MAKKLLVIAGSPRKGGNSDILCDAFIKGAVEAGHDAEKIWLQECKLSPCMACYACRATGKCVHKDGMDTIIQKMIVADVIVLATPVYFYTMSGQMKVFIDRVLPGYRNITGKDFYFIATAADDKPMLERTMDGLAGFTDCLPGAVVRGRIYGDGFYQRGEIKGSRVETEAYNTGKRI